ncbi:hypothetical protein ACOSP7_012697 [Xanthoceras sorbifolium]
MVQVDGSRIGLEMPTTRGPFPLSQPILNLAVQHMIDVMLHYIHDIYTYTYICIYYIYE